MKTNLGVVAALLLWLATLVPVQALDPTKDKILYVVATAHLDDQWNWTIQDTINTYVPATLYTNFNFFAKYPHYTFSFEEILRYRLTKEYYPAAYVTLSNFIAQGRWRVTGSSVVAGDVNVPSPEALMRQILYGNGFWSKEFGKTSLDIYLPDCFGFGYALPSIAAHCGLKGFSSQKLTWGGAIPIPFQNLGKWTGPDGGSLIAVLQPGAYNSSLSTNLAYDPAELTRMTNNYNQTGLFLDYRYFGTGDTGGGPTDASVNWLEQSVTAPTPLVNVLSAGGDQLYRDLTAAQINQLPVYQGELLMKTHGTGCYTSHPEMKKWNRQNEQRADAAERLAVMADWLQGGGTYPQEKLNQAWERFLWHQFHDDLTGTSIPNAYTFSWNDELLSLNEFGSEETHGAGVLAQAMDTTAIGVPVLVYNGLGIPREDIVEAVVDFPAGAPSALRVFDATGAEVPSQMGTPSGNSVPVTFLAAVPAVGAAVFDVRPSATPCTLNTGLSVTTSRLENARYRVQLNASGDVSSIYDKVNNRELLNAPLRWAFLADSSTSWPAWEIMYSAVSTAPTSYLAGPPAVQVLENGPARVGLGVTRFNAGSGFVERVRLAAGGAGDRVEWDVTINWGTLQTLLKVVFPLAITNSFATYDLGLGTVSRTNSNANVYEVPAQQWADLTTSNRAYGVSILNDCKYGWDKPDNSTLRLTILHTPAVGGSYVYQATNGIGSHRLAFAVMGHTNDWSGAASPWTAARLNQPLQAFQTAAHAGFLGKSFGFLSVDNPKVMLKAVKKAENSNEVIVRLQELSGQPQTVTLSSATAITTARQVTGAEAPISSLAPLGGTLTVALGAYAPMTIALNLLAPTSPVSKPVSAPVSLPFNLDAISTDANRTDGNFDGGYTYPAELMPSSIVRDGITFQLGPTNDGAANSLSCAGQTLALPAGYDRLYLLAAAASNDVSAPFLLSPGGAGANVTVRYFSGFIGQWTPPFVKNDELGWVCTHRHTAAGNNDAYRFCYLFKYRIDLPPGTTSLTLPNCPNLRIFAASVARNTTADTSAAGLPLVQNQVPWAVAGPDRLVNAAPNGTATITLDASGSADPDGSIVSYAWTLNGSPLANGVQPTVTLSLGTNSILLTVTDNQGAASQDLIRISVLTPLNVTIATIPTNSGSAPLTVLFNGQATGGTGTPSDTTDDHLGTITAQGQNSPNELATNAFDNNLSSKWLDFANAYPSTRSSWIQYQYAAGAQRFVTNYTITSGNDASGYPARNPANWHLLGSNDGGTTWATLDIQTNQVFTASMQTLSWPLATPGWYNIYRLQIDSVANPSGANSVQLDEIQFIAAPSYSFLWSFGDGATSALQNPSHAYTTNGVYLITLSVTYGIYTGTNTVLITVGPGVIATASANPFIGTAPLTVQFSGAGSGGNGARAPYDTTEDHYGTITAQGNNPPNETCVNAFDNTSSTKWLDFASADPATRSSWIQYQYAGAARCIVSSYTISSANDAPERDPADWHFLGSTNGGSSWTTLDIRTGQVFTNRFETHTCSVPNTTPYNLYRLQIDSVANPATANSVQLSELQFIGKAAYNFWWSFGDGAFSTDQNPLHTFVTNGTYLVSMATTDGTGWATNSLTITLLPLPLAVTMPAPGSVKLAWPSWGTNYNLFATTNLAAPAVWLLVTNAVGNSGGLLNVSIPLGPGARFFQLR